MEEVEAQQHVRQILETYLAKHKMRKTPERFAILDAIYAMDEHFNMERLHRQMLEHEKFRVSRATLYNTIELLVDARLVIKHQFGTTSQYERCYNCETHHHQICTHCGSVSEIKHPKLQEVVEQIPAARFKLTHYSLYLYGLCSKCQKETARKEKTKQNEDKK